MSDDPLFHDEDHKRGLASSTLDHVRRQLLKAPPDNTTKGARWDTGSTGLGQFSVWKSDAPGARDHTILHPEVAKYLRVDPRWMTVLAEGLRALDDSSGPVDTVGKRQRRLGHAISILNFVMEHHPDLAELNIREDLAVLSLALVSLEAGVVHPLLRKPAGFGNRPPDTRLSQQFRVNILTFVVILERTGMTRNNALRYLAGELSKENVGALKPKAGDKTLAFNWLTIKGWYYRAGLQSPATSAVDASNDDAVKVAALIAEFVARAFADRQSIPPPLEYAKSVIRGTMRSAAFRSLAPGGGA